MTCTRRAATEVTEEGCVPFRKRLHFVLWWAAVLTVFVSVLNFAVGVLFSDGASYEIRVGQCAMFVMYGPPVCSGPFLDGLDYSSKGTRLLVPDSFPDLRPFSFGDIEAPLWPRFKKWGTVKMALIPLWPISLSAIVYLVVLHYRKKRERRKGGCPKCGYNLTGNVSGICPECGVGLES